MPNDKASKPPVKRAKAKKPPTKKQTSRKSQASKAVVSSDEYNKFLSKLELKSIMLEKANVERDILEQPSKAVIEINEKAKLLERDDKLGFIAHDNMRVRIDIEGQEKPFVKMNITFALEYECKQPCNKAMLDLFAKRNLNIHVWPYHREYIQSAIQRMGLPAVILPPRLR